MMTPAVFPTFLHVYQAENDCDHEVRVIYSILDLAWKVYHDGDEAALIENMPDDPNVLRGVFGSILRTAHSF